MTTSNCAPEQFRWLSFGANCNVYEVNACIVVKVPKDGIEEREQFSREVQFFDVLSHHPPCAQLISCFLYSDKGIFLEYMHDICLSWRIQQNHTRDERTKRVTSVERLEPLPLRKQWMSDLAKAVAFLESLGYAHGDLRPENVLLSHNRLKLTDFDCTAPIGEDFEACIAPYGRLLGDEGGIYKGTAGQLGPRTEQFALGSLYYLINYGFEVYGNVLLGSDACDADHGPIMLDLLQAMKFPALNGHDLDVDSVIEGCWHGQYASVAKLAEHVERITSQVHAPPDSISPEDFTARRKICEQVLASEEALSLLSIDPRQRGLSMERRWINWDILKGDQA